MALLYRIQDEEGHGPYRHLFFVDGLLSHHTHPEFPSPQRDSGIRRYIQPNEFCAFASLDSLCQWFTGEELYYLEAAGYQIVPVEGNITARGEKQVLFVKP